MTDYFISYVLAFSWRKLGKFLKLTGSNLADVYFGHQWSRTGVTQGAIQTACEDVSRVFLSLPLLQCGMRLICVSICFLGKLDSYLNHASWICLVIVGTWISHPSADWQRFIIEIQVNHLMFFIRGSSDTIYLPLLCTVNQKLTLKLIYWILPTML